MRSTCLVLCACAAWLTLVASSPAQPPRPAPPARPRVSAPAAPAASAPQAAIRAAGPESVVPPELAQREYYDPGETIVGGDYLSGTGAGGCNFCGTFGCSGCGPMGYGCLSGVFVRAEYLLWSAREMNLPPLVTTSPSGTARFDAGVLGEEGTTILFGGDPVGTDSRTGGRLTFGRWFDPCQRLGVEAEFFALDDETSSFQQSSTGDPIIAVPFFDVTTGSETASLVAFPNVISGTIGVEHVSRFEGAGVRALYNLCCGDGCGTSCITHCPVKTGYRFDMLVGYRFVRLDDCLAVVEDSTSLETANPGSFFIRDRFNTENQFHGVDFGTSLHFCKGCFTLDLLSKLALGNTRSVIDISGSTVLTQQGTSETFTGGILAQRTNIGSLETDEFAVVPELGVTIGYQLNPCWRFTAGYSFIYMSRVARAGDLIDRNINPNLFPPEDPVATTNLRPQLAVNYTDFWAQGLNLGLEAKW